MHRQYLRFNDLKARGVVNNRTTLQRWIATQGFPPGFLLGPSTRVWTEKDIADFEAKRRAAGGKTEAAA